MRFLVGEAPGTPGLVPRDAARMGAEVVFDFGVAGFADLSFEKHPRYQALVVGNPGPGQVFE